MSASKNEYIIVVAVLLITYVKYTDYKTFWEENIIDKSKSRKLEINCFETHFNLIDTFDDLQSLTKIYLYCHYLTLPLIKTDNEQLQN